MSEYTGYRPRPYLFSFDLTNPAAFINNSIHERTRTFKDKFIKKQQVNPIIRLRPGYYMSEYKLEDTNMGTAMAEYGIEYLDLKTLRPVARSGFFITNDTMVITHMPQGVVRTFLNNAERRRLVRSRYRSELMNTMMDLAQEYGVKQIRGISAHHHLAEASQRHNTERFTPEFAKKNIDDVLVEFGFTQESDGDFYLVLK